MIHGMQDMKVKGKEKIKQDMDMHKDTQDMQVKKYMQHMMVLKQQEIVPR